MCHITTWEEDYKGNNTSLSLQSPLANSSSPSCRQTHKTYHNGSVETRKVVYNSISSVPLATVDPIVRKPPLFSASAQIYKASVSRPALGPTQPPFQWVPGVLSPGVKLGQGVTLTTHPHLVPRSRMSRCYSFSPPKRLHGV
jgi:hypothetical protein